MAISTNAAYSLCNWLDTAPTLPPATAPQGWQMIFVPKPKKEAYKNYAVILQSTANTEQLAIVIQGTKNGWEAIEDFSIDNPAPFVNSSGASIISGAEVANGGTDGLTHVLKLRDKDERTLEHVIKSINLSKSSLLITGHSLGGAITTLLAPWLASSLLDQAPLTQPLPANMQVITFAAFAAGNQQFATYLNGSSQYQPNINLNDIVPYVWANTGDYQVSYIYTTFQSPGPRIPGFLATYLEGKVASIPKGFNYIQTNEPNTFSGQILAAPAYSQCLQAERPTLQYKWEVSLQHNYAYCVNYIGSGCTKPDSTKC
jgi:triacylglycerol lipase